MSKVEYSEKLNGLILLRDLGLPVLQFFIVDKNTDLKTQIERFLGNIRTEKFCVRVDEIFYHKGTSSIIDATLEDLDKIQKLVDKTTVFISHPGNIYRNMHSVNILKDNEDIVLEIIGPGFITPDMDKKGLVHEQIVFDHSFKQSFREILVDDKTYSKHIAEKIGNNIDLHKTNKSRLLEHSKYVPLSDKELSYIIKVFPKIRQAADELQYSNFVASLSFIEINNEQIPIFWDIFKVK